MFDPFYWLFKFAAWIGPEREPYVIGVITIISIAWVIWLLTKGKRDEIKKLKKENRAILLEKIKSETRLAKMAEYMSPFMEDYPYDPDKFRFLGNPCDGIQFTDDEIIFIEIKTGKNNLSKNQTQLKHLVENGKTRFAVYRLGEDGWSLKFSDEEENE